MVASEARDEQKDKPSEDAKNPAAQRIKGRHGRFGRSRRKPPNNATADEVERETSGQGCVEEEAEEELVIVVAHTIANPGTMMVHAKDTFVAHGAVVRARRSWFLALLTIALLDSKQ